jgi:hypothetical protein
MILAPVPESLHVPGESRDPLCVLGSIRSVSGLHQRMKGPTSYHQRSSAKLANIERVQHILIYHRYDPPNDFFAMKAPDEKADHYSQ